MTDRITSTYVENTPPTFTQQCELEDHLHIRGEYIRVCMRAVPPLGSPPHTWRIQGGRPKAHTPFRITSTYVENTVNTNHQDHGK